MNEKKVGCYVRVSTLMQDVDKDAGSLVTQESLLRSFVEQKNALSKGQRWAVVEVYRESASAKDTQRREFQRMMRDIADGRVTCVVFTKLDRISRSTQDLLRIVQHFEAHKCEFHSLQEDLHTTGPMGRFMLVLLAALAELERATTAERVKGKMDWRAEVAGLWNGGPPRLGYDSDPANKGILGANAEERVIVEQAFEIYLQTGSVRETARRLNDRGWRTKSYISRRGIKRGGGKFSKSTLHNLLTDRVYRGEQQHAGKWLKAKHEPIVGARIFEQVQAMLKSNGVVRSTQRRTTKHIHLLEGMLYCNCGAAMTTSWSRNRFGTDYRYYRCARNRDASGCGVSHIRAEEIERVVAERLIQLSQDPALLALVLSKANQNVEDRRQELRARGNVLLGKLTTINGQIEALVNFLADGGDSSAVRDRLADVEAQKAALQNELDEIGEQLRQARSMEAKADSAQATLAHFSQAYARATMEQKKQLFQLMIDHAVLEDDKLTLAIYDVDLSEAAQITEPAALGATGRPEWWTVQDSNL